MKKLLRYTLRVFGGFVAVFLLLWVILWAYLMFNKSSIITKVKTQINKQIKGDVMIGDLRADFIRTFPYLSVRLSNVSIRDPLWKTHHHDFIKAERIYVRIRFFSLFTGKPQVDKVIVENGSLYLFTDSTGYTNLVTANDPATKKSDPTIPSFLFKNTRFVMENKVKHKYHDIEVTRLQCDIDNKGNSKLFTININSMVHSLAFNTDKGSYAKEKTLEGKFRVLLIPQKVIQLDDAHLKIDKQPFIFNARFFVWNPQPTFILSIQTKKINYKKAGAFLTPAIKQKTDIYNIVQPFDITATITGMMVASEPLVRLDFQVNDADIETPVGQFNNCSFTGSFVNEVSGTQPRVDANSRFVFKKFTGKWENIPLSAKTVEVFNLTEPFLTCDLRSVFALKDLNDLTGSSTIQFIKGLGNMDVTYKGSLKSNDTIAPVMNGNIRLNDAEINYVPRNFSLKNCSGNLEFKNHDLLIQQFKTLAGGSNLNMNGSVRNLLSLINISPERLIIEWNISTPNLNLSDFMGYLAKRSAVAVKKSSSKSKLIKFSDRIDRMLKDGTAKLNIQASQLSYKKFVASSASASVLLLQNEIAINEVQLNHAGGKLLLSGSLTNGNDANFMKLHSTLNNVDIPGIFHAFSNFGQDAITDKNMRGRLTADINITGSINDNALISENSLKGLVDFSVVNGELINFEPVEKISETAFKKRDFSDVRFAELKNKLEINGSAIKINRMEIRSNVLTMFVAGVYDTKKGTDMSIQVPLSNIKKPDEDMVLQNKGKVGINVRLRAKTGDDGKLKVSWDPFNKASKELNKETAKTDSLSKTPVIPVNNKEKDQ